MLLSEYLGLESQLDKYGVFDPDLQEDSHFFINLQRLKQTTIPEFCRSYEKIHDHFRKIIKLLVFAEKKDKADAFYKRAIELFDFSEVNGICLGYAKGVSGAGFGRKLREDVISTAFDIVKSGIRDPEFFELLPLFQENVGADRLSDMIATLILDDIRGYTRRINQTLHIDRKKYPDRSFHNGFLVNPYKNDDLLLVPMDILHLLPVAESWEDIDNVVSLNESVRAEMNDEIANEWKEHTAAEQKKYIKERIFQNPEVFNRIINSYNLEKLEKFTLNMNADYYIKKIIPDTVKFYSDHLQLTDNNDSLSVTKSIFELFKSWVEFHRGWEVIQEFKSGNREKMVQTMIQLAADAYNKDHKWDISREPDAGRGPVDFKISRGNDKTVIEVKLSSSSQYIHGYTIQIEEYAKAEQTENKVYVLIDLGHPGKVKKLREIHDKKYNDGENPPDLVIIDARKRISASKA